MLGRLSRVEKRANVNRQPSAIASRHCISTRVRGTSCYADSLSTLAATHRTCRMITSYFSSKGKKGSDASEDGDSERKRGRTGSASAPSTSASSSSAGSGNSASKRIKSSSTSASSSSSASAKPTAAIFGGSPATAKPTGPSSEEVRELISSLDSQSHGANDGEADDDSKTITWRKALDKHVHKPSFSTLAKFVASQRYVVDFMLEGNALE